MAETHFEKGRHGLGILLVLLSELGYGLMQISVALTDRSISVPQQIFVRNVICLAAFWWLSRHEKVPFFGPAKYRPLLIARAALGLIGIMLLFYAVRNAYQADVTLMSRMSMFTVTAMSAVFLHERIGVGHVAALLMAFAGAYIAANPRFDSSFLPMFAAFMCAMASSAVYILLSYFSGRVHPTTILLSFCASCVIATFPMTAATFVMPSLKDAFFMFCTGLAAVFAQITMTYAYRMAPPGELGIYSQTSIIMGAALGWFFLGEIPSRRTVIGGIIILAASFLLYACKKKQMAE